MIYKCSICEYSSGNKHCITRHFNKKIKCGDGIPIVTEIKTEIKCNYCNKNISTNAHLIKHLVVCKVKKEGLEEEVRILKEKLAISEALNKKPTTINNNQINIILTAYNNPNLENIEKHLKASVKKIFMAVPTLVEKIHFNNDIPENHNLVIKNARTKLAKVFNGKKWTTVDEEQLLDELVDTYESLLIEYSNENGSNYSEKMNKIKSRDSEEKVYGDMKVEVKKVLYENRDMIKIK